MGKTSIDKVDFSKISKTAAAASTGNDFIPESYIIKSAWGDENDEVEFVPMDNGTYLIEQNGIGMGFTNQEGYDSAFGDSTKADEIETLDLDEGMRDINDPYVDGSIGRFTDTATGGSKETISDTEIKNKFRSKHDPYVDGSIGRFTDTATGGSKETISNTEIKNKFRSKHDPYVDGPIGRFTDTATGGSNGVKIEKTMNDNAIIDKISDSTINELNLAINNVISNVDDIMNSDEVARILLEKSFPDIYNEGYEVSSEIIKNGDNNIVVASKNGEKSKLYVYDENLEKYQVIDLNFTDSISNVIYDEEANSIKITLDNDEIKEYNMDDINSTITGPQSLAFANDSQKNLISTSEDVPSPGGGLCAMWVSQVFNAAGYDYTGGNANDMYDAWCTSSDKSELKPGMIVAVSTHPHTSAGSIYGHVGIYIGNGMVRDNVGTIREISLDEWIDYYGDTVDVKWGWLNGTDLSKEV